MERLHPNQQPRFDLNYRPAICEPGATDHTARFVIKDSSIYLNLFGCRHFFFTARTPLNWRDCICHLIITVILCSDSIFFGTRKLTRGYLARRARLKTTKGNKTSEGDSRWWTVARQLFGWIYQYEVQREIKSSDVCQLFGLWYNWKNNAQEVAVKGAYHPPLL